MEGNLADLYERTYDRTTIGQLRQHHTLGVYFGAGAHPETWRGIRNHKSRSTIWKARANSCGVGANLIRWGIAEAGSPETRCCCRLRDPHAPPETLYHLIFNCPLFERHAGIARQQPSIHQALGFITENTVPPHPPVLADRIASASESIKCFLELWQARNEMRLRLLQARQPAQQEPSDDSDSDSSA